MIIICFLLFLKLHLQAEESFLAFLLSICTLLRKARTYCMYNMSCQYLYCESLYKNGQEFSGTQFKYGRIYALYIEGCVHKSGQGNKDAEDK